MKRNQQKKTGRNRNSSFARVRAAMRRVIRRIKAHRNYLPRPAGALGIGIGNL